MKTTHPSTPITAVSNPADAARHRVLVSRYADFWLMGGLSIVFLGGVWVLTSMYHFNITPQIAWTAYYAAFVVNFPHFAYSYQLFYKGFGERLLSPETSRMSKLRMMIAGVIVPVLLLDYFAWSYATENARLLGYAVQAMYFFVGWHYVKQGYGALITLSVYRGIFYSAWEKRILYGNAYAVWLFAWIKLNSIMKDSNLYYDIRYFILDLPDWVLLLATAAVCISTVMMVGVFLKSLILDKKKISVSGVTGYICASYLWTMLPYINPAFFISVAFFHSLQYLPFVFKYKASEFKKTAGAQQKNLKRYAGVLVFIVLGIILGGGFLRIFPDQMDMLHREWRPFFSQSFFAVMFSLFINIHHYFIDSAFWRRDNRQVQDFLFKA